jgi:hypothetical protein
MGFGERKVEIKRKVKACPGATGCGYATVSTAYECLTFHNRILTCQVWARVILSKIAELLHRKQGEAHEAGCHDCRI